MSDRSGRRARLSPRNLVAAAAVLLAAGVVLSVAERLTSSRTATRTPTAASAPATTATPATATAPATPAAPATTAAPVPPSLPMSWDDAGAILWHSRDSDPMWLGRILREQGFGWAAVFLGPSPDPNEAAWVALFRQASGLPVGGWSVLGGDPAADAAAAARLIAQDGLSFYIADAEAPYVGSSARSRQFVAAFRTAEPTLPAALSSFCEANALDLGAWARAGFDFLPQAYVNDFGSAVSPLACVRAAAAAFPSSRVHPTVAIYTGKLGWVAPDRFAQLLRDAGTSGFSVFPAETARQQDWQAFGEAIATLHIAARAG